MSFLVRYPVGNTAIRDCQYWPTITRADLRPLLAEVGYTTINTQNRFMDRVWPCPVSQEVLMHMAWRTREWIVAPTTFTYTGRQTASPTPTWKIDGVLPQLSVKPQRANPLRDVTDEQDLLGPASDLNLSFTAAPDRWKTLRNAGTFKTAAPDDITLTMTAPGFNAPFLFVKDYRSGLLGGYVLYDPITQLFYPPIGIGGNFGVFSINPPDPSFFGYDVQIYCLPVTPTATPDPPPLFGVAGDVQQGTLTIINPTGGTPILVPIGMFGEPGGSNPPISPSGGSGSANFTMTPVSWWEYKNSLDQPVYNTSTGAVINDPFA